MSEQCLKVIFPLGGADLKNVFCLERELAAAIEGAAAGQYDGNEIGDREVVLYMYGPDADAIFNAIAPVVNASPLVVGGSIVRRYGPPQPGVRESRTPIPSH